MSAHSEITLSKEEKGKCENRDGHNVSLTMNSAFPARHRGTMVTLEIESRQIPAQ